MYKLYGVKCDGCQKFIGLDFVEIQGKKRKLQYNLLNIFM